MATVTKTITPEAAVKTWAVPGTLDGQADAIPFGCVDFAASDTVLAKGAADETQLDIVCNLPVNYAYRIESVQIQLLGSSIGQLTDLARGEVPGFITQGGVVNCITAVSASTWGTGGNGSATVFEAGGGANSTICNFMGYGQFQIPLITGQASGDNVLTFMTADVTTDTTTAILVRFRLRALMYSVSQYNSFAMFQTTPITG